MSIQITEAVAVRFTALASLVCASGSSVANYIFLMYPPDAHPIAKGIGVGFGVLGLIGLGAQAMSKPLVRSDGGPPPRVLPLLLALLLLPAIFGQLACDQSQIRKAIKTSDRVVELCDQGERVIVDLKAGALIDEDDAGRIEPLVAQVRTAALELGNVARSLKGDEPDAKVRLKAGVLALSEAAERLEAEGVLHVKNEKARERLRKVLALARIGVDVGL
jgi:hypothetical protein